MLHDRAVINSGPLVALSLAGVGRPGASALTDTRWLAHVCPTPTPDPLLVAELDPGEAAVIALARSMTPCVAIIDEKRGRKIAHQIYGLPVKGTAGLLVEAHRRGLLSDVRVILLDLKRASYFLSDAVIEAACAAAQ